MDISKFKERFIEEAYDLIKKLEESLLDQEENLNNKENVQQIFRVLHTLKGTSAMYGYVHIGDLVHDLETIFDLIREDKQDFTPRIFDTTLKIVDHLRNLLKDEFLSNTTIKEVQDNLLAEIKEIVTDVSLEPHSQKQVSDSQLNKSNTKETYYIIFHPTESQLFRCINILQIFNDLAEIGEYKIVNHSFQETDIENDNQNAWGIYLVTDKGMEAIEEVFMFVMDDCKILKISPKNLFDQNDFLDYLNSGGMLNDIPESDDDDNIQLLKAYEDEFISSSKLTNKTFEEKMENNSGNNDVNASARSKNTEINQFENHNIARINIDANKLDRLMYLVSELVITKSQLNLVVATKDYIKLIEIAEKIDDLSRNFRDNALNIRLVQVAEMMVPFKRLIRDLSKDLGKEVRFVTKGIETELDKNVIDKISEPIMHILRNCIDHGIESSDIRLKNNKPEIGSIKFNAFYSGANVIIQIEDDGRGIDPEKIKKKAIEKGLITNDDNLRERDIYDLIFYPGFSLATKITEVSGRGVGMDIVRKKINELRGEVEVSSEIGKGTIFTIKLHQTLSIIDTLLLKVEDAHYLVPVADIEFCEQEQHQILYKNNNRQVEVQGELLPFISLRDLFEHSSTSPVKEKLIIVNKNDAKIAIVADKIIGEHQAVLKPLGEMFHSQQFLSGASFLGDGTLALMLDTNQLTNKELVRKSWKVNQTAKLQ